MKYRILFLLILFTNSILAQTYEDGIYLKAKQKFDSYENQHGDFLQTQNANIHYLTWGNPSDIPLIWSHGSFSNGYELLHIAEDLVAAGYYLIALDYYGHGQSSLASEDVSLYHVADDIYFLMNHLNIGKAVIGGWSRGGYISSAFYDAYPEHTLGLILEDGGSVATNLNYHKLDLDSLERLVTSFDVESYIKSDTIFRSEKEAFFSLYDPQDSLAQFQLLAWIKQVGMDEWAVNPNLFELFHHQNSVNILNIILRPTNTPLFAASMAMMEPKIIFRNLNIPILILDPISHQDLFPFEKENENLKLKYPDLITLKKYYDTGHNIHSERPLQFVQDLHDFLKLVKSKFLDQ
ncbi:alpha/beta hydrolase [Anditalea andensis]|uniref:AB hydrolase-1 domain-containing protein n=1 Tax=Anditalea andensis TaxID=1048983 RepID=A0A074LH16_9BACT|nr:alpha/beta hydrolase [Anditalea andensis]KEO73072.1 hypothetical protein EL17_15805 [Anditalea andensis]